MEFKLLYISIILFFTFAKTSFAAVPSQTKYSTIGIAQDSILICESDFLMQQDSSERQVQHLLQRARKLSNSAFVCILTFFTAFWLADVELYYIAIFMGFSSILVGFILGLVALALLTKAKGLVNLFPEIAQSEYFKENWRKSLVRSILVASLFSGGLLLLGTIVVADSELIAELNPTVVIASFGGALLLLFDRFGFKTRK
jgi:hypothetical protein